MIIMTVLHSIVNQMEFPFVSELIHTTDRTSQSDHQVQFLVQDELLNGEICHRGRLSRVADTELRTLKKIQLRTIGPSSSFFSSVFANFFQFRLVFFQFWFTFFSIFGLFQSIFCIYVYSCTLSYLGLLKYMLINVSMFFQV